MELKWSHCKLPNCKLSIIVTFVDIMCFVHISFWDNQVNHWNSNKTQKIYKLLFSLFLDWKKCTSQYQAQIISNRIHKHKCVEQINIEWLKTQWKCQLILLHMNYRLLENIDQLHENEKLKCVLPQNSFFYFVKFTSKIYFFVKSIFRMQNNLQLRFRDKGKNVEDSNGNV